MSKKMFLVSSVRHFDILNIIQFLQLSEIHSYHQRL